MLESPSLLLTIAAFLLLLGPLVVVHELGHYLVARLFGVKADAFSVGFGKELAGWTDKRGTRWKLSRLPLGGYVQFAGDMNAASHARSRGRRRCPPEERARMFQFKPLWQRSLIVAAGPVTNLLFRDRDFRRVQLCFRQGRRLGRNRPVSAKIPPAQAAGMKLGDRIVAIDGGEVESFTEIPELVAPYPGRTMDHCGRCAVASNMTFRFASPMTWRATSSATKAASAGSASARAKWR